MIADHRAVAGIEDSEGKSAIGPPVGECLLDPRPRLIEVSRPWIRQPGEHLVGIGGGQQAKGVLGLKWLDSDKLTAKLNLVHRVHGAILADAL